MGTKRWWEPRDDGNQEMMGTTAQGSSQPQRRAGTGTEHPGVRGHSGDVSPRGERGPMGKCDPGTKGTCEAGMRGPGCECDPRARGARGEVTQRNPGTRGPRGDCKPGMRGPMDNG